MNRTVAGGFVRDWTPVVLLVCSLSLTLAVLAWLLPRWLHPGPEGAGPGMAEHGAPAEVTLWVYRAGDDGLKLALTPVWGDEGPDQAHDLDLGRQLGLGEGGAPAWYRLLIFNLGASPRRVELKKLALGLQGVEGQATWRSLPALLASAGRTPAPAQLALLRSLGALTDEVDVPARGAAPLLVCFDQRVNLSRATMVAGAQELTFARRPMPRGDFQRLVSDPDEDLVRDL